MSTDKQFGGMGGQFEQGVLSGMNESSEHEPFSTRELSGPLDHFYQEDDPDADSPLFATDEFRVWCMKVIPCTKRFVHDWTVCPFAHAGEKAVRRDPRTHTYTGIACPDMKKSGNCIRGERCPYAHNFFEYWLHPTRYRTQLCNDGPVCRRGICFFAHSLDELRVPACKPYVSPEALARASVEAIQANPHPLSAQLPLSSAGNRIPASPMAHQGSLSHADHEQAVLAALSAPPRTYMGGGGGDGGGGIGGNSGVFGAPVRLSNGAPFTPQHYHNNTQHQQQQYNHIRAEAPRISSDYGSLPRWSDSSAAFTMVNHTQHTPSSSSPGGGGGGVFSSNNGNMTMSNNNNNNNNNNAGRFSYGGTSDYASACSTPARVSADYSTMAAQERELSMNSNSNVGAPSGRSSGNSAGSGSRHASLDVNDDELAHSLATLKIALTQQNAATTTASNHEVVINTLHQILREAMENQSNEGPAAGSGATLDSSGSIENGERSSPISAAGGGRHGSDENTSGAAAAAAYSSLASNLAALAAAGATFPGSATVSDVSADTPGRSSMEDNLPSPINHQQQQQQHYVVGGGSRTSSLAASGLP